MNVYIGCTLVLCTLIAVWFFWLRYVHIGVGMMLEWQEGRVMVVSRLTNSPAGRAGIKKGHQILEINYMLMTFDSGEDWVEWNKKHPNILRGIAGYRHRQAVIHVGSGTGSGATSFQVKLTPELIITRIPYHPPPLELSDDEHLLVSEHMRFCKKTGEYYTVQRLNSTALLKVFPH